MVDADADAERLAAEAHELYRRRELVETPSLRPCRLRPPPRRPSPSCSAPLPARSPRAWRFAAARAASHAGALLSDGLRIGYAHGFDSGPFMAHVYADGPPGAPPWAGRWIAACSTGAPASPSATSARLAETAVLEAADAVAEPERPPVIADLAAGSAPYLLRALAARPARPGHRRRHRPGGARGAPRRPRATLGVDDRADVRCAPTPSTA